MTTSTMPFAPSHPPLPDVVIDEELRLRLIGRVLKDAEFRERFGTADDAEQRSWAERIVTGTVTFLRLCAATSPGKGYSPSPLVDIGWHCFILYTREYAAFCRQIAGRVIHHSPHDRPGVDYGTGDGTRDTVAALAAHDLPIDSALWAGIGVCDEEIRDHTKDDEEDGS
ncbi:MULTISPECIES: glycine-rich domain-containing protein [Actinoalloteichus]|uniref:Uncharacterized protein n=1 Tax=Actinoalloteichus fjordicus TaxID=1612552 RepID=A0AAC9LH41_9PSEU|nr:MULTISPECIES: hypothetical protein [Actinoalloteichus]APU17793.1 hypothetical protein UA74_29000 [Actinoalloteichus fjordicus]APU23872.1 hypothetical protein UA75_29535 [Actinoalloteichus sp. GBA129-24]